MTVRTTGPRITLRVLALAFSLAPIAAQAADSIRPGYWEARDQIESPIHGSKTERRCITPDQVTRFMSCYLNHHYVCECAEQSYAGGQIRFRGMCVDHKGARVAIQGHGTYTETTLNLTAEVTFKLLGLPMSGEATTEARRLGDICPPDAK